MSAQDFITKCLELSERATTDLYYMPELYSAKHVVRAKGCDRWVAHFQAENNGAANGEFYVLSRTALPKVCEALKIAIDGLRYRDNNLETLNKINKLFDDADGG
jgi:hypothetical protein